MAISAKKKSKGLASKKASLSRTQPGANKSPARPGFFSLDALKWEKGSGPFRGVLVAVVSEDPKTGAKAMFLKIPVNRKVAPRADYHYHTRISHSFVIEGSTMSEVSGRRMIAKAGDYFRAPANWVHAHAGSDTGATIFMVIEGSGARKRAARFEAVASEQ
ncbi:MAG TPA: cupin domain-containing protein [Blastocatellia bacterium]|nr:cupin domain-containing protein [Blastocatellia bacterium]